MSTTCSVCGDQIDRLLIGDLSVDERLYSLFFCGRCEVGVISPMPGDDDLERLYAVSSYRSRDGKRFNPAIESFIYLSRIVRKNRIKRFIRSGSVLDIGCGGGLFLDVMKRDGWIVTGAEFNAETARDVSGMYAIPVVSGSPSEWSFSEGNFDVITMNHVLEHLREPDGMVAECRRLLRKGGLFVCSVPNIASLQASAGKGVWFHLDIPYHIHHFTEAGLTKLLKKHSFSIVRVRRFDIAYGPFGWLQTLLNISGIRRNYLYSLLKNPELRKGELAKARKRDLILTSLLLPCYFFLAFFLSFLESFALKKGGSLEIFAIKQ